MNFDYKENGVKKSFSCQTKASNIVYPNVENMIVVPITKRMEIVTSIQVCIISRMPLILRKMVERKAFLTNPKHQYLLSQCREDDCSANNKKNEHYSGFPSLSHSMNEH